MKRRKINGKFFTSAATAVAVVIAVAAALLLMATGAYAQAAAALQNCSNGVHDGNETGVDCGGSCFNKYILEVCDGKDNDKDCLVDNNCKTNAGKVVTSTPAIPVKDPALDGYSKIVAAKNSKAASSEPESVTPSMAPSSGNPEPSSNPVTEPSSVPATPNGSGTSALKTQSVPLSEPVRPSESPATIPQLADGEGQASAVVAEEKAGLKQARDKTYKNEREEPQAEKPQAQSSFVSKVKGLFKRLFR